MIEEHITVNPSSPAFRHGKSLGSGKNKDWSWVKFGAGRYRLFFRYSEKEKVIILGWMNDENTLRTYGKKTGNDSNLLIVFYVQIMPDDFVMQLHRF